MTRLDEALVRATRESHNEYVEYVMSYESSATADDQASRRLFVLSPDKWDQLSDILDRSAGDKLRIAALLAGQSVLERHSLRSVASCGASNSN